MKTNIECFDMSKVGLQKFTVNHRSLKPCPFCGDNEPDVKIDYQRTWHNSGDYGEVFTYTTRVAKAFCTNCPAQITLTHSSKGPKTEPWEAWLVRDVVKAWNKRARQS